MLGPSVGEDGKGGEMKLNFEYQKSITSAENASAVHMPDNSIWLFSEENGRLMASEWIPSTSDIDWGNPDFELPIIATSDKNISLPRIKNIPRVGIFGSWHQDEIARDGKVLSPERHRLGIWDALNDLTPCLQSGSIQMNLDNIISSANFTFKNPFKRISGENASRMLPGKKIELFFTAGDSDDYPMGVFYVDHVSMETAGETVSVECRNISGKVLKDQTLNADYNYPKDVYAYVVEDFLDKAGVEKYKVQQPPDPGTAWQLGLRFPVDMDRLTALNEMIRSSLNWVIRETLDGEIIAGSAVSYDEIIDMYGTYEFARSELVSRRVERDDSDVYSRVCYQAKDTSTDTMIREYVAVEHEFEFSVAFHKTLYITAPDDTPQEELQDHAEAVAEKMAFAGVMETFKGMFRPHIIPGDEAVIVDDGGTKFVGLITTVIHEFGEDGFFTEFTVDSGGTKGKPMLKDLISKISDRKDTTITRTQ